MDTEIYDEVITVDNKEAFDWARRMAREEGILGGISSGAAVAAAAKVARRLGEGKKVVAVIPSEPGNATCRRPCTNLKKRNRARGNGSRTGHAGI